MLMLDDECTMCGMGTGAFCDFYFIIFFVNRERTHIYIKNTRFTVHAQYISTGVDVRMLCMRFIESQTHSSAKVAAARTHQNRKRM